MQQRTIQRGRPAGATTFEEKPARAFGTTVRSIRTAQGLAQETLAKLAGIERSHIGKIERGQHMPTLAMILKIAKALNLSAGEILTATENLLEDKNSNEQSSDIWGKENKENKENSASNKKLKSRNITPPTIEQQANQEIPPFLKWAGGKRWLVEKHPHLLKVEHKRYIEPFVGSGAVFFNLLPDSAILCDKNEKLIEVYSAIKDDWERVEELLLSHHKNHSADYYYEVRQKRLRTPASRAAQFIYLNRTCWNGLYRVNKKGEFNVPIGTRQNAILSTDDFEKVSLHLKNVELISGDFEIAISKAESGDFVFIDPPYTIKHNDNGFLKYNESIFSWDDQIRLRYAVEQAISRGAKVLVTNACHDSIKRLYENIGEIITLDRASIIAGKSSARGRYEELVIKCF